MRVNIKGNEIELKYSFRAFIIYENITDKPFQPTGKLTEFIILFYATVMSSKKDLVLEYEEFVEWLDEDPNQLNLFISWMSQHIKQNSELAPQTEGEGSESKNQ